ESHWAETVRVPADDQRGVREWMDRLEERDRQEDQTNAHNEPTDVRATGADVLICSPYKFCGPHLGMAYGRASVIEQWRPYKARPAPTTPLGRRFETGTQPHELLAGVNAPLDYLDPIGGLELIVPPQPPAR